MAGLLRDYSSAHHQFIIFINLEETSGNIVWRKIQMKIRRNQYVGYGCKANPHIKKTFADTIVQKYNNIV